MDILKISFRCHLVSKVNNITIRSIKEKLHEYNKDNEESSDGFDDGSCKKELS